MCAAKTRKGQLSSPFLPSRLRLLLVSPACRRSRQPTALSRGSELGTTIHSKPAGNSALHTPRFTLHAPRPLSTNTPNTTARVTTRPARCRAPSACNIADQMVTPSSDNDPPAALDGQAPSRSFFSRFALPIRSRNVRNVVDFHIRPAEPHRKYNAGDAVRGHVILTVVKPIRVTHLTVALRGSVRVYKNSNAANEPASNADIASDGISRFRFLGNGYASLFQDEQVLCAEGKIDAGKYEFGFELMFPEGGLPTSIEVGHPQCAILCAAT